MARIIEFEGRTIEVPDDATDDEIRGILEPQSAPAATAPQTGAWGAPLAPVTTPTPYTDPARALTLGAQDVGKGAANAVGFLPDLLNTLLNTGIAGADMGSQALGGPELPFRFPVGAGEAISGAAGGLASAFGAPPIPDESRTPQERLAGNMIDFGTQAALPAAGLAAAAPRLAERLAVGAKPRAVDNLVRPYLNGPGVTLTGDVAGGVGAGVGQNVVDENVDDASPWKPLATLAATFGGGIGGTGVVGGARSAGRAAETALNRRVDPNVLTDPMTQLASTRAEVEDAARLLQELARDPQTGANKAPAAAAAIAEKTKEFRDAGLPVPTSGLISENLGLRTGEAAGRTKNGAPFVQNDDRLRAAATERVNSVRDPNADQSAVAEQARVARENALLPSAVDTGIAEANAAEAATAQTRTGAPLAPYQSAERGARASRALDEAVVDQTYIPARDRKNQLFNDVDPGRTEMVSSRPVLDAIDRVAADINNLAPMREQMPEFAHRLDQLRQRVKVDMPGGPVDAEVAANVPLRDLVELRKYLSTAKSRAQQSGAFDMADNISTLQRSIDEATAGSPAANAAMQNYRSEFAPTFRPGPGDEMGRFTRDIDRDATRSTTPPERTAGRFLSAPEKAEALRRVLADSPAGDAGRAAVRDYLLTDFASSVLNENGTIRPAQARAWADANDSVLAQFPDVRREFDQLVQGARTTDGRAAAANTELQAARKRAAADEANIERSQIGVLLREDPRDVAKGIFRPGSNYSAAARLDEIDGIIGTNETARRGWKAAVAEAVSDMVSGTTKIDEGAAGASDTFRAELGKLDPLFKAHRADLAKVFTPEEMNRLQQGHALLEPLKNAIIRASAGSNTADKFEQIWRIAEAGLKAKFGVLKGGGYLRTFRILAATLPNNNAAVARLVERAYFDPDLMQYLLTNKVRNLDYEASNKWIRRAITATAAGREAYGEDRKPLEVEVTTYNPELAE